MQLSDFEQDKTYRVVQVPFTPPDSDETIPGKELIVKILEQANASNKTVFDGETTQTPTAFEIESWSQFLRVENQGTKRIHLLHPETLASAELVYPKENRHD